MKQKILTVSGYLLFFLIAAVGGWFMAAHLSWSIGLVMLLCFLPLFILIIYLHELGHFLFGHLVGYRLMMFKVGPIAIKKENDRFVVQVERSKGYAGFCMMTPPVSELPQWKNMLYYAGGIISNFATGILAFLPVILFPEWNSYLLALLWLFSFLSTGLGATNLSPSVSANNATDGMIIHSLLKKDRFAQTFIQVNQLSTRLMAGIRPRDIEEITEMPGEYDRLEGMEIYLLLYKFFYAYDTRDMERLRICAIVFEKNKYKMPSAIDIPVSYELCFTYCLLGDFQKASDYYRHVAKTLEKDDDLNGNRVKAFYRWYVMNDREKAVRFANRALEVVDKYPLVGQRYMERDLINRLLDEINRVN